MKKLLLVCPFVLLVACNIQDPDLVANATSAVESAPLPDEDVPVDSVIIYGVDDNGDPILTPPEGSVDALILQENSDGDDLRAICELREPNYACGTRTNGTIMVCQGACICWKICWGPLRSDCESSCNYN